MNCLPPFEQTFQLCFRLSILSFLSDTKMTDTTKLVETKIRIGLKTVRREIKVGLQAIEPHPGPRYGLRGTRDGEKRRRDDESKQAT